ncbi:MAG TPA: hypothetical protein VK615_01760, partial [Candidatus Binatia bacterium]|nr:hypothetical protein [Candidatus Binatia bacterium]
HYDSFAEFHYSYHYGDRYIPFIKQEEPLRVECQHFLDCIKESKTPLTSGRQGMDVVKVLEAASASLKQKGAAIPVGPESSKAPVSIRRNAETPMQRFEIDVPAGTPKTVVG